MKAVFLKMFFLTILLFDLGKTYAQRCYHPKPFKVTDLNGVTEVHNANQDEYTISASNSSGYHGCDIEEVIENGMYVSFIPQTGQLTTVGFSITNSDDNFNSIGYGVYARGIQGTNFLCFKTGGPNSNSFAYIKNSNNANIIFTGHEVVEQRIEDNTIFVYFQGAHVYTFPIPITTFSPPYVVDIALGPGASVNNLNIGCIDADCDFACDASDVCPGSSDVIDMNSNNVPDGCECTNDTRMSLQFTNKENISTGYDINYGVGSLTSSASGPDNWTSGAYGEAPFIDGSSFRFKANSLGVMVGLSVEDDGPGFAKIRYALNLQGGVMRTYRYGICLQGSGNLGSFNYATDEFIVRFYSSGIQFIRHTYAADYLVYTFPVTSNQFTLDVSLRANGAAITSLKFYSCGFTGGGGGRKAISGFSDQEVELGMAIAYPNPFENTFTLGLEGSVKVFDSFGRLIVDMPEAKTGQQVDLTRFASGVYFLEAKNEKMTKRIKLNKQ